ncbi:two-component sensor histidine kinase [[Clostridium] sordellii]|uniref:histidine kinase n=1 Tax=Paraclostridium sordellii TaxID=1505 RepID=A0ABM9RLD5_PARSO|nr:ATP-binding protein [Paeniclostridium sordellii]CEJ72823.1 Two-component sensor histidine kinase,sporulation-associated spo0A [[Clostridium] sordellii] [Paeniclostridium sordellii]CEN68376.1 two-component sensor histidine kinase [[Clostridium] sordellii] [Paeniclostridium sordellii]CEN71643.1 two-component sensor histidine kinase [[Clostridium] sordellii] [Paeniclostridium sordellii]CEO21993.1 two-component sensor histidine kinase [[Clostridium] sordellii] [Paeniclostridium sordellii]CEP767
MDFNKHSEVLEVCPIPCVWGKRMTDFRDKKSRYIIEGGNKLLIEKLGVNSDKEIIGKSVSEVLGISRNEINSFSRIDENKQMKYQYVCNLRDIYKVTLSMCEDDKFFIWFESYHINNNYSLAIQNNLKAMIWIKDVNGRYIKVNRNFEEITGLEDIDIIGKKNSQLNIGNTFEYMEEYEKLVLEKKEHVIEKTIFEDDEWISVFIHPMYDNERNIIGTYGFKIYDYVNSKTPIGIENRNKMLEIIVDNLPIPIFYKDKHGVYLYCNEAFDELIELDRDNIIGKKDYDLNIDEERVKMYKDADNKVIKHKVTTVNELYVERKSGDKYIEITKVPLWDYRKKVIGVIGIVIDLTQKKATEIELEKLRLDFFSNLTHEFRTPLNLIFSSVQLIDQSISNIKKGDVNVLIRYLRIIEQNGMRLLKLVNNLIDSTRIDSGCLDYNPQNKDIVAFVENICESVVEFSHSQNIDLIFDTDQEEKIISFDSDKMERIVLNLLSNAIKYNKENGRIDVGIKCNEDYIDINVRDTGVGIPSDKIGDVFEKFKQVDNRLTKISEGSGIGLSIVKSLVALHNGMVDVSSKVGVGTEFKVKIPNKVQGFEGNKYLIRNESINMNKKIQIEFSDIY